jgi:selenocysteine lyase/cysteine desulfurase
MPGDIIVTSDMLYHSLVDALLYISRTHQLTWIQVDTPQGGKSDDIYQEFETRLRKQPKDQVKLVIVDHISSKPSVLFPVDRICRLCKSLQIPTLIDGAHVPGSIPSQYINVERLGATFYAVTFHKWCNTPRGGSSGGLWVNTKDVNEHYKDFIDISSLVVHGGWVDESSSDDKIELYDDTASKSGYFTDGLTQGIYDESTREYENIAVLPHCLDLVLRFETEFQEHVKVLRYAAMEVLQKTWDLSAADALLWYGDLQQDFDISMLSMPLPTEKLLTAAQFTEPTLSLGKKLKLLKKYIVPKLWSEYAIEVPVFVWKEEMLGVRLSFGRHVQIDDIQRLGECMVCMVQDRIVV